MIIKGQVIGLAQNNLTICPKARHQWVRCEYIQLIDGRTLQGPWMMKQSIYDALQSGQSIEFTIGRHLRRLRVKSVQLTNGQIIGPKLSHNELRWWLMSSVAATALLYASLRHLISLWLS